MYLIYMLPYNFLTAFFGVFGSLLAIVVVLLGLLRLLFLIVLLITMDFDRFRSEQTEGLSLVIEKIKNGWKFLTNLFK